MNIQTVAENLRNTIKGKEALLTSLKGRRIPPEVTIHFLEVNIDELKRILVDVESCIAKDVEQSWRDNPDRMGGQFTQDEINNSEKW